jgi:hypothetical protein
VRSAASHASGPLEFVIGGSVGNEQLRLGRLTARLPVEFEVVPGRSHSEWLDHWVATSPRRYAVFLDSDVFIRRHGWDRPLVAELAAGAALVTSQVFERVEGYVEPIRGVVTTMMRRPAPWLMAVDVTQIRETGASFAYRN